MQYYPKYFKNFSEEDSKVQDSHDTCCAELVDIDEMVLPTIKLLNEKEYGTIYSCAENEKNNWPNISWPSSVETSIRVPKTIARIKLCGALEISINDTMNWQRPTDEQIQNLKETFGIEVILEDE